MGGLVWWLKGLDMGFGRGEEGEGGVVGKTLSCILIIFYGFFFYIMLASDAGSRLLLKATGLSRRDKREWETENQNIFFRQVSVSDSA